ncbi:winged helix-turn-helix domain-containing protein [Cohnella suwonensis]|uniref:Winged helix-turn-helix domain-containing protein n=1 Tax=Cohnella suwonensis TaxID=696072 RepID=A0ABW0M0E7_9BACL
MVIMLWTRCWTCSLPLETEIVFKGHQLISIVNRNELTPLQLDSIKHILLYWPTLSASDLDVCLSIRKSYSMPVTLICQRLNPEDASVLTLHDIEIIENNVSVSLQRIQPAEAIEPEPNVSQALSRSGTERSIQLMHSTRTVKVGNKEVELSRREFGLLKFMFERSGKIIDREELIHSIWDGAAADSNVYITIQKLRQKIEENPQYPKYIVTKKGGGYMLYNQ